jgi:hypothetical protein
MQSHEMSKDPKQHDTDPALEKSLGGVRKAWSMIGQRQPPELLDQSILNAARRELESGRRRPPLRWLGAFATATVMVLALSLLLLQYQLPLDTPLTEPNGYPRQSAEDAETRSRIEAETSRSQTADVLMRTQADSPRVEKPAASFRQSAPATESPVAAAKTEAPPQELQNAARLKEEPFEASELPPAAQPASDNRAAEAEAWIDKMLLLLDSGQDEKLVQQLAAFKEAFPDYPLPDSLRDY